MSDAIIFPSQSSIRVSYDCFIDQSYLTISQGPQGHACHILLTDEQMQQVIDLLQAQLNQRITDTQEVTP